MGSNGPESLGACVCVAWCRSHSDSNWNMGSSLFLLVFAGLFMLFRIRPKPLSFLLVLLSLLAIGMTFSPTLSLHASIVIPLEILAFVTFVSLLAPLSDAPSRFHSGDSGSGPKSNKRSILGLALIVMLFFPLQTVVSYQMAYNVPLVPPSSAAQQQLSWIGSHIGRDNATTILLVDNHYTYLWAAALATPTSISVIWPLQYQTRPTPQSLQLTLIILVRFKTCG